MLGFIFISNINYSYIDLEKKIDILNNVYRYDSSWLD